jgi:two-component system nitrate/nitrite response regulator NarL
MAGANAALIGEELTKISGSVRPGDQRVITILISTSALLRLGVQHILSQTRFAVLDRAVDPGANLPLLREAAPVLVLIDVGQDAGSVKEVVRSVKAQRPQARAVLLAHEFDLHCLIQARRDGVDGFCLTSAAPTVLIRSLELVMLGEPVLPSATVLSALRKIQRQPAPLPEQAQPSVTVSPGSVMDPKVERLTNREWEILGCLGQGAPNKEIAQKFNVSEMTVKVHVKAVLRKIGAANRTQAAMWAVEHLCTKHLDPTT